MTDDSDSNDASLPLPALECIETACLQFEAIWKQGERPRIENYLGTAQGPERSVLFRELLLLDLEYRSSSDEQPSEDEYQARFPQDSQLVSDIFKELSTGAAATQTSPSSSASTSGQPALPCPFGDYELQVVLGEGGMGIVYRARQQTPDRTVALKIIRPDRLAVIASEQRARVIERFRAETQAAASLEHEHIVPVFEVGQIENQPFFHAVHPRPWSGGSAPRRSPYPGTKATAEAERLLDVVSLRSGHDRVQNGRSRSCIFAAQE